MNSKTHPHGLMVIGFGGHARSVADVALALGIRSLRFVTATAAVDERWAGHPVVRDLPERLDAGWQAFLACGDGATRQRDFARIAASGWPLATIIAPTASVSNLAAIADGVFIGHQAHVGPGTRIGRGTILNSGSITEHDAEIGCFAHISVNSTIAGYARVGDGCFIGAGATVIDKVSIAADVVIGAGAVVTRNITRAGTYVGVPARSLSTPGQPPTA